MRSPLALALIGCLALAVLSPVAGQEEDVPLPRARPDAVEPVVPLPRPRPVEAADDAPTEAADEADADATPAKEDGAEGEEAADAPANDDEPAPPAEPAPPPTPPRDYQSACPAMVAGAVEAELQPPIAEGQCLAQSPWLVTAVAANGRMVPLSSPATMGCELAATLPGWLDAVDGYLWARENTRLARLLTGTSYMCRNVNNASSGNLSFHGFANALDVVGFELEDGRTISLPEGWEDADALDGRLLRFAHDAACARFTTTLGPEANALHEDHLHIDMGCHGKACRARLCE